MTMFFDYLKANGFSVEIGGGGTEMLTRYWPNGVGVWVTGSDGPDLPDDDDWLICVYAPDGDTMTDALFTASSDDGAPSDTEWRQAIDRAMAFAGGLAVGLAGAPAGAMAIEVSAFYRTGDKNGPLITGCNAFPKKAEGFGVYIRNPLASHVQDFDIPAWLDKCEEARGLTLSAAFAYADHLAAHLGCKVDSQLARPVDPVSASDLMDSAMSLWEAAIEFKDRFEKDGPTINAPWKTEFLMAWEDHGTAEMRWRIQGFAERCHREYCAAVAADTFGDSFDWEWCPDWLARELESAWATGHRMAPGVGYVPPPVNGRRMVPGDLFTAPWHPAHALFAYPADGGAN